MPGLFFVLFHRPDPAFLCKNIAMKALEDQDYETIKSYILEGNESTLPLRQREMLNRWVSASKLLEKNPVTKKDCAVLPRFAYQRRALHQLILNKKN